MAGHSKWAQIKRKKAVTDQKRGQVFTRHAQLIALAAKDGANPDMNPSLRSAIDRAKVDNTPKSVIDRAILKGSGQLQGQVEDVVYDLFGPHGSVLLVEASTDNQNRTRTDIHTVCMRSDARMGERGSAAWMFTRVGHIRLAQTSINDEEQLALIDAGAQDVTQSQGGISIETGEQEFGSVVSCVRNLNKELMQAGLMFKPNDPQTLSPNQENDIRALQEALESLEDVEAVYTNIIYEDSRD